MRTPWTSALCVSTASVAQAVPLPCTAAAGDFKTFGDSGVTDLLLHHCDHAYRVPELLHWLDSAGMRMIEWCDKQNFVSSNTLHPLGRAAFRCLLFCIIIARLDSIEMFNETKSLFTCHCSPALFVATSRHVEFFALTHSQGRRALSSAARGRTVLLSVALVLNLPLQNAGAAAGRLPGGPGADRSGRQAGVSRTRVLPCPPH